MPIYLNNKSYDIALGNTPIEKMGGDNMVTYSMYGEEPPMKETGGYELWGYGYDVNGNMGSGEIGEKYVGLKKIADNVQDISSTYYNNLIYVKNNKVYIMGGGNNSSLNLTTNTLYKPQVIYEGKNIKKISISTQGAYFLLDEDKLYVRGNNIQASKGAMGLGGKTSPNEFVFVTDDVINVATNSHSTMCIKSDGIYYTGTKPEYGSYSASTTFFKLNSITTCDEIIPLGVDRYGCYKKGDTVMRCFGENLYYTFSSEATSKIYNGTSKTGIIPASGDIQYTSHNSVTSAPAGFRILDKTTGKFLYSGYFDYQSVTDSFSKPMGVFATNVTCICEQALFNSCSQFYIQNGKLVKTGVSNAKTPVATSNLESQIGGKIIKLCANAFIPTSQTGVPASNMTCAFFLVEK